jgi:hypothetical protein
MNTADFFRGFLDDFDNTFADVTRDDVWLALVIGEREMLGVAPLT